MKLRVGLLVIAAALAGTSCRREQAHDAIARPMWWTASRDGATSYLFGTMHGGVDAATQLPRAVFARLDAARTFAMETDVGDGELIAAMQRTTGTLHDDLGPAHWAALQRVLSPDQARAVDRMKPMVAATLLAMRGLPPTQPMDRVLRDRARERGIPVVQLETAADELAVLDKHLNVKALRMMLDDPEGGVAMTRRMLAAYLAGDEARMLALMAEQRADALFHGYTAAEYDAMIDDLLYRRNAAWIPVIERVHAGGGGFVAVGAMHLVGPRSVRALLEARGFQLERL